MMLTISSCSNEHKNLVDNSTKRDSEIGTINSDEYLIMKDNNFLGLPANAIGVLGRCKVDINKDNKKDSIEVFIKSNADSGVNVGALAIGIPMYNKEIVTGNEIVKDTNLISNNVYYNNGYFIVYSQHSSNFGAGSVYGFSLKIFDSGNEELKIINSIKYIYAPNYSCLEDVEKNKIYYSSKDSSKSLSTAVRELNQDLDVKFNELLELDGSDFILKDLPNGFIQLCEITMGETDYNSYYYQSIKWKAQQ